MDNALVTLPPAVPPAVPSSFGGRIMAMPARSKLGTLLGLGALAAILITLSLSTGQGDYKPLYTNLSDKDGGAVIAQLAQMNVPYKVTPGNGAILVPATLVPDLRLKMATAGLPKGSVFGYELMDSARFGQTQFQERLTFQRGLEGELTRSITSLAAVQNARVHLALPNQNGFFREQQKPSASVLLNLHPGRSLERAQIAGIVHLVSSSVPELDPKAVSVLDQSGALLTGASEGGQNGGLDAQQLQYVSQIETGYSKRIYELLEPIVGHGNLRATVAADIDFTQSEATSEEWKPNQGGAATVAVRSQQTNEQSGSAGTPPSGVPGAASNQPPLGATAPLSTASQPAPAAAATAGAAPNGRREAVTNYEVDKTVRVTKNASGNVKRLNAAVVVNNRSVVDAKGKTTQQPLSNEEVEKLTALVREGIGFKQDRGDSVKVINAPFRVDTITPVEVPFWKQPDTLDLIRTVAWPGALAVVAMLVFFGLVKPAVKAVLTMPRVVVEQLPPIGNTLDAVENSPPPMAQAHTQMQARDNEHLELARSMARQNPAAVAGILRGWVAAASPTTDPNAMPLPGGSR